MEDSNNQNSFNQPVQTPPTPEVGNQPVSAATPPTMPVKQRPFELLKSIFKDIKNKKIFKILLILFAIILFIIISGTIYSLVRNSGKKNPIIVVPSAQPTIPLKLTEESKKSQTTLEVLKGKISKLDSSQKHLTPPSINFDISF